MPPRSLAATCACSTRGGTSRGFVRSITEKTPSFFVFGDRGTFRCFRLRRGRRSVHLRHAPGRQQLSRRAAAAGRRGRGGAAGAGPRSRGGSTAAEHASGAGRSGQRHAPVAARSARGRRRARLSGRARGIGGDARRVPAGIRAGTRIAGHDAPAKSGHRRGGAERHGPGSRRRRTAARLLLQPFDLSHQRAARGGDRIWRARSRRRDAQVPELTRERHLPQRQPSLRLQPGGGRHPARARGGAGGGLHGRHRGAPVRLRQHRGVHGHGVDPRTGPIARRIRAHNASS